MVAVLVAGVAPGLSPVAGGETAAGVAGRAAATGAAAAASCPATRSAKPPAGPSEQAVVGQEARGTTPEVEVVRFPRPDTPGRPWSHWGQGLVIGDGRVLAAMGNHLGKDGNAYLFVYDPSTRALTRFADVRSVVGGDLDWGFGKIHGQIVAGSCGDAYFATYWGTRTGLAYSPKNRGDVLARIDPSDLGVESLGAVAPERGIPSLAAAPGEHLIYGEAVDPFPTTPLGRDQGTFFAYDTERRAVAFRSDDPRHAGFRNILVDAAGAAYVASDGGRLLQYRPGDTELREHPQRLPGGGMLRASTTPTRDGTVFGVTQDPDQLFAMRGDGRIESLGAATGYTASLAAEPDGSRFYYVPGAHGDAPELGAPVIAVDGRTGEQTTIVRLAESVRQAAHLEAGGSYSVVLDPARRLLYVTLNAGATSSDPWGEVVLAIVHLPASPGGGAANDAGTPTKPGRTSGTGTAACTTSTNEPESAGSKKSRRRAKRALTTVYRAAVTGDVGALRFDDATDAWGATAPLTGMRGHAVAAADVNADGWTDVFVGTFADRPVAEYRVRGATGPAPDRLLLGGPDGFRVDSTFPGVQARTSGATFGDLDGDGDPDLVIARNVRNIERGRAPTEVLRNDGGRFTSVTSFSAPAGARSVGLVDFDADGRLDLFVTEDRFTGGSSVLWRNRGDFRFEDATQAAGIGRGVVGMGVGTADLDADGDPDLFVGGSNRLFLNQGDGRFAESRAAPPRWVTYGDEDDPAGVAQGDVNGDGRPDIVVGQHYNSTLDAGRRVPVRLYLNEPDGAGGIRLRDVTDGAGLVGLPTKSPHVDIVDLDSDGRPDILTTAAGADGRPIVFRNVGGDGDVRFEASSAPGPAQYWVTAAVLDADHDGRLDVVAVEWEPSAPTRFFRSTGNVGHWLAVDAPVGSVVEVRERGAAGAQASLLGTVVVGSSTGYGASPSATAWFGLGDRGRVDVAVSRPGAARVQWRNVRADRALACRA